MNKNFKIAICFFIILSFLGLGLYFYFSQESSLEKVVISIDYPVTSKLECMVDESDYIIVGSYFGFNSSWNMARNPKDITKEDTERYIEGRLYDFRVDEILKGTEVKDSIKVNHRYLERMIFVDSNEITNSEGIIEGEKNYTTEYSFDKKDILFIEPELNAKYILFLKKDLDMDNYYGSIEPFSIKFNSKDISELQSNLIGLDKEKNLSSKIKLKNGLFIDIVHNVGYEVNDSISNRMFTELVSEIENQINN
ncbi:hypothetical protein [Tissierella praeacuta]|uniref:hypothetical protein n=1 Tax=Tissierella praeacuta TaxID=43131 RepID=UPI00333F0AE5